MMERNEGFRDWQGVKCERIMEVRRRQGSHVWSSTGGDEGGRHGSFAEARSSSGYGGLLDRKSVV